MLKKTILKYSMLVAFLMVCISLYASPKMMVASKNIETKIMKVGDFDALDISGSIKVVYKQGSPGVKIVGPDNIIPYVDLKLSGKTLSVSYKSGVSFKYIGAPTLTVNVSSTRLSKGSLSGSGDLIIDGNLNGYDLQLSLSGSGDIVTNNIQAKKLDLTLNGSGDIAVNGIVNADNINVSLNGSGDINTRELHGKKIVVSLNGSGDVVVKNVKSTDIYASVNGSGDMEVSSINATAIYGSLNGSGNLSLRGNAKAGVLNLTRSGDLDASSMKVENLVVSLDGSGDISCYATKELVLTKNGSGDISYRGTSNVIKKGNWDDD